ncbi:MAG: rRNA pseudouridine synthase [Planctomycetes bacterium]|nr:rRNA pseudouridine synthase [Planctomycetota bacterium]
MSDMRLQRWLAMCGVASRRRCEELITSGRVDVNGAAVTELGSKVDPDRDEVRVDGERVKAPTRRWYVALNKPVGVVCTGDDPAGRPRAIDLVASIPARLFPIGRLDEDSEGLLLLTNDGDFAEKVAHPRYEVPKVYRVTVRGIPDPTALAKLMEGVWLSEGKTAPARVMTLRKTREFTTILITLHEGRNREVRRMLAKVELPVTKLLRVQVGSVKLGTLKRGEWRLLAPWEVQALQEEQPQRPTAGALPPRSGQHRRPGGPDAARMPTRARPGAPRKGGAGGKGGGKFGKGRLPPAQRGSAPRPFSGRRRPDR